MSEELGRLGALHERGVLSDDEFARAKARVLGGAAASGPAPLAAVNALRRSRDDRWLGGVCGGLAVTTGVESWLWRLLFLLLACCVGSGLLVYLLMWFLVPLEPPYPGSTRGQPQAG